MKVLVSKANPTIKVEWNEINTKDGIVLVLKQGATLKKVGKSVDKPTLELRSKATKEEGGKIITIEDLTFRTKSSMSNFIEGCQFSGQRWCESHLGIPNSNGSSKEEKTTITTTTKEEKVVAETTTTKVEEKATTTKEEMEMLRKQKQALAESVFTFCKDIEFNEGGGLTPRLLNSIYYEKKPEVFIVNSMQLVGFDEKLLEMAKAKFSSREFKEIVKQIKSLKPSRDRMNKRLEIFYGPAGTGKTTKAVLEYPKAPKIVASASADPDDLFTRFNPETKKYELTEIGKCMVAGEPIIIDEANLYNRVVLTRLQGITDETASIVDRGIEIKIAEGFKIIITMNLETNFGKFALPVPLVNRASRIENFADNVDLSWVW